MIKILLFSNSYEVPVSLPYNVCRLQAECQLLCPESDSGGSGSLFWSVGVVGRRE